FLSRHEHGAAQSGYKMLHFNSASARIPRKAQGPEPTLPGNHIASSGNSTSRPSNTNMMRWNGIVPITTSASLPVQMLWITNKLIPIGGEIWPISMNMTRMTPNQIGSTPYCSSTGYNNGTVTTIMPRLSTRQPNTV